MKKKILSIGVFMIIVTYGFSQFEIKTNPISMLVFGSVPVSAEYVINDNIGTEVTFSYLYQFFGEEINGFSGKALLKYYFGPNIGGDRFYGAAYLHFSGFSGEDTDMNPDTYEDVTSTYKYNEMGLGFAIGFKWVSEKGILLDIGGGVGRNFIGGYEYNNPEYPISKDDFMPINFLGRLSIGYRFGM